MRRRERAGALLDRIRTAVLWGRHHVDVPVGVVDVGSNTVRVLVSEGGHTILSERDMLHLGADIERHGAIPKEKIALTAAVVGQFVRDAHSAGATAVEVLIASPGRQAENGQELAHVLQQFPAARCASSRQQKRGTLRSSGRSLAPARPEAARSPSSTWEAAPRRSSSARERQARSGRSRSTSARSG